MKLLLIASGGALGAVARYFTVHFSHQVLKATNSDPVKFFQNSAFLSSFPIGTFTVNILGSFLAGVLYFFLINNFKSYDENLRNFFLFGFLGAFTTFSAFSLDFFRLFTAGQHVQAMIYAVASVVFSILLLFLGFYLAKATF